MRTVTLLLGILLFVITTTAFAQSTFPWMLETSPTARVWAMGFAGGASTSSIPALYSPGSVGLWAFNDMQLAYSRNQGSLTSELGPVFEFSNDLESLALHLPMDYSSSLPGLSVGVLRRTGRSSDRGLLRHYDDWTLGFGIDVGFEIGFGWNWSKVTSARAFPYSWEREFGMAARFRLNHVLRRFGSNENALHVGEYVIEPSVTFAATEYSLNKESWAFHLGVVRDDLPLADVEYVLDDPHATYAFSCFGFDQRRAGWEVVGFGTVAYRWGNRKASNGSTCDPDKDWRTKGWAIDFANGQRWIRRLTDMELPSTVEWILDHVQARYESASFRHPERVPMGYGDTSMSEWSVGLTNVAWN